MNLKVELDFTAVWRNLIGIAKKFNVSHFLLLYFAAHLLQIAFPSDGGMVFDEAHYVPASLDTLQWIGVNSEHLPLSKIIGAIGIALFGNNWFGWRFPQVIMQVAALYLFYLIAKRFLGDPWALGATIMLGLDTLFFIHGGTLLLDEACFFFSFLAFELYFRKHYALSAVSMGLGLLAREMTLFTFIILATYHVATHRKTLKRGLKIGISYTVVTLLVFGILLWAYDAAFMPPSGITIITNVNRNIILNQQGNAVSTIISTFQSTSKNPITNPFQHVAYIMNYHGPFTGFVLNETDQSYFHPLLWIVPVDPFNVPTYYRLDVTVTTGTVVKHLIPIWYRAQGNLPLWYGIWPAMVGLAYAFVRKREWETALFMGAGIATSYLPWEMLDILVRRIGFNYFMIYTLPYIALALAFSIKMLPSRTAKAILVLYILAELAFFLWFFPVRPIQ
jgi:4-amino-4-deoxy-L-arabinose transferase-like glycosyltransferase